MLSGKMFMAVSFFEFFFYFRHFMKFSLSLPNK